MGYASIKRLTVMASFPRRVTLDGAGQWQPRLKIAALQYVDECHTRQSTRRGVWWNLGMAVNHGESSTS